MHHMFNIGWTDIISWHFMAFWHVCQKANCITKSAFSAFSRLFPPFRLFHWIRLLDFPALVWSDRSWKYVWQEQDKKLVQLFKLLNAWKLDLLCLCLKRPSCPCLKLFLSLWSPKWVNFDSPQTFSKSQTCIKTSLAIIAISCKSRW